MTTELVFKSLKVAFDGLKIDAGYGDVVLNTDLETVKTAVTAVAGVVGPENCVKLGVGAAVATAMYVASKSVSKYYPWAEVVDVKENNILEVSVPPKYEEKFDKLVADGKVTQSLQNDFEDLDTSLMAILGDRDETVKNEVLKLIENVRIKSVSQNQASDIPADLTAAEFVLGKNKDKVYGRNAFIAGSGKGPTVMTYYGKDSDSARVYKDGNITITSGVKGEDLETLTKSHEKLSSDLIPLTIRGQHLNKPFESKFTPRATIEDVVGELYDVEKKKFHIFRDKTLSEQLKDEDTILEVARKGSMLKLRALTESEVVELSERVEE